MSEWISTKKGVPCENGPYLVCYLGSVMSCMFHSDDGEYFEAVDGIRIYPSHWMNLPDAPKVLSKREKIKDVLFNCQYMNMESTLNEIMDKIMKIVDEAEE